MERGTNSKNFEYSWIARFGKHKRRQYIPLLCHTYREGRSNALRVAGRVKIKYKYVHFGSQSKSRFYFQRVNINCVSGHNEGMAWMLFSTLPFTHQNTNTTRLICFLFPITIETIVAFYYWFNTKSDQILALRKSSHQQDEHSKSSQKALCTNQL